VAASTLTSKEQQEASTPSAIPKVSAWCGADAAVGQRPQAGADHFPVDVAVDPAVDGPGAGGGQGSASRVISTSPVDGSRAGQSSCRPARVTSSNAMIRGFGQAP